MIITPTLSSALGVGLDSDLANHDDLDDLLRGAERAARYLWSHLGTEELLELTKDLRQFVHEWDRPTVRLIEDAMNGAFSYEEEETHLRPTIQRIVAELDDYFARAETELKRTP